MVEPENIDSGHSSFQLDDRSGCHHCNLARLLIHALTRPNSKPATAIFKSGHWPRKQASEAFPWDTHRAICAGPGQIVWCGIPPSHSSDGNHGSDHCPAITLAEPLRRASDQLPAERLLGDGIDAEALAHHALAAFQPFAHVPRNAH